MNHSVLFACLLVPMQFAIAKEIRVGLIGCDTSHVIAFTETWNNPQAKGHVLGCKLIAAFRGGSPDIKQSVARLDEYSTQLREEYGVTFYDTTEELCANVDAVCLECLDVERTRHRLVHEHRFAHGEHGFQLREVPPVAGSP